jgi:hypothetical protein
MSAGTSSGGHPRPGPARLALADEPSDPGNGLHVVIFVTNWSDRELLRVACLADSIPCTLASDVDDFVAKLRHFPAAIGIAHVQTFEAVRQAKSDPSLDERPIFVVNSYGTFARHLFDDSMKAVYELPYPFQWSRILEIVMRLQLRP